MILSDMCPLVSGITTRDAALSVELGMRALDLAVGKASSLYSDDCNKEDQGDDPSNSDNSGVLHVGGHLILKLLESEDIKGGSSSSFPYSRQVIELAQDFKLFCVFVLQKLPRYANHSFESHHY